MKTNTTETTSDLPYDMNRKCQRCPAVGAFLLDDITICPECLTWLIDKEKEVLHGSNCCISQ